MTQRLLGDQGTAKRLDCSGTRRRLPQWAMTLLLAFAAGAAQAAGQVQQEWLVSLDAPGHATDWGECVARGPGGRVLVAGYVTVGFLDHSIGIASYTADGQEEWRQFLSDGATGYIEPEDMVVDQLGNAYIAGWSSVGGSAGHYVDSVVVKYDAGGQQQWDHRDHTPDDNNQHNALAVDHDGNILAAGASWIVRSEGQFDALLRKYDPQGNVLWSETYHHSTTDMSWDALYDVAVGPDNSVVAVGYSEVFYPISSWLIVKYDANGSLLWARDISVGFTNVDEAWEVAVDQTTGDIYVAGDLGVLSDGTEMTLVKYSPAGVQQWIRMLGGSAGMSDYGRDLALDPQGNVVLAGTLWEDVPEFMTRITIAKYDPAGLLLWTDQYVDETFSSTGTNDVVVDAFGAAYVAGYIQRPGSGYDTDYIVAKWDPAGEQAWVETYAGEDGAPDEARAVTVDDELKVYTTGPAFGGTTTYFDFVTIKYDQGYLPGDLDNNGVVDLGDVAAFIACTGGPSLPALPTCAPGLAQLADLDDDDDVDLRDYATLILSMTP